MKKTETNKTEKTYKKASAALLDSDLDMVSGGMTNRPPYNSCAQDYTVDIAYRNNCQQELGEIWEGEDCPIKDKMICRYCNQPITLNLCHIEQRIIRSARII